MSSSAQSAQKPRRRRAKYLRNRYRESGRIVIPDPYDVIDPARPTREGGIGANLADRSKLNQRSAALGTYPYADTGDSGEPILADVVRAPQGLVVVGGSVQVPESGSITVGGAAQWKLHHAETFALGKAEGWTNAAEEANDVRPYNLVSTCAKARNNGSVGAGVAGAGIAGAGIAGAGIAGAGVVGSTHRPRPPYFLGPYGQMSTTKAFVLPNDHSRLLLQANVHFIDKWDHATLIMRINGAIVWQKTHNSCAERLSILPLEEACKARGVSTCGNDHPDTLSHLVQHTMSYFAPKIEISFESDNAGACGAVLGAG
jgi:hypothetical protein